MKLKNYAVVRSLVRSTVRFTFIAPVVVGLISASAYGQMVKRPDVLPNSGLPYGATLDIYHGGVSGPSQPYRESVFVASLSHDASARSTNVAILSVEGPTISGAIGIVFSKVLKPMPPKNFNETVPGGPSRALRVSEFGGDLASPGALPPLWWAKPNTPFNAKVTFYEIVNLDPTRPIPLGFENYSDVLLRSYIAPNTQPGSDRLMVRKVASSEQTFTVGEVPYFKSAPVSAVMTASVSFRPANPADGARIAMFAGQKLTEFMQGFVQAGELYAPKAAPGQWTRTWLRNDPTFKAYRVGGHLAQNAVADFANTFKVGKNSVNVPNPMGSVVIYWQLDRVLPPPGAASGNGY